MPFTQVATDRITAGTSISLTANNHDAVVLPDVIVASSGGIGISATGSDHDLRVLGTVSGFKAGVRLGDAPRGDINNNLNIGDEGVIYGHNVGVAMVGRNGSITNRGDIYSEGFGVSLSGSGQLVVTNYDLISATTGINVALDTTVKVKVINSGTIEGDRVAYNGGNGVDHFVNSGNIRGNIVLGGAATTSTRAAASAAAPRSTEAGATTCSSAVVTAAVWAVATSCRAEPASTRLGSARPAAASTSSALAVAAPPASRWWKVGRATITWKATSPPTPSSDAAATTTCTVEVVATS